MKRLLPLRVPVRIWADHLGRIDARTDIISAESFYCLSPVELEVGASFACELLLGSLEHRNALRLRCVAKPVRVDKGTGSAGCGIAFAIEEFYLLPG